jgi:hypothetical protein
MNLLIVWMRVCKEQKGSDFLHHFSDKSPVEEKMPVLGLSKKRRLRRRIRTLISLRAKGSQVRWFYESTAC